MSEQASGPDAVVPAALVVDDDPFIREGLREILELEGYRAVEAADGRTALDLLDTAQFDLLLVDLQLPRVSGIDVLRHVAAAHLDLCTVIISGHGSVPQAVATMRLGAYDFLEKPLDPERTLLTIRNALDHLQHRRTRERSVREARSRYGMIGSSAAIGAVFESIDRAAATRTRVLLVGESGTGKELVARAIHRTSRRASGPFVPLNCAAIPETLIESELFGHVRGAFTGASVAHRGRFEQAHRGSLLLDEIGDMSLLMQAKLLRVIEDDRIQRVGGDSTVPVDVRLIAATNRDLEADVRNGDFREDLFYRLSVFTIHVPPLRHRTEDIPQLAEHFLRTFAAEHDTTEPHLSASGLAAFMAHDWPGNVRELRNVAERLVLFATDAAIDAPKVRAAIRHRTGTGASPPAAGLREARDTFERAFILRTLDENGWRIQETALTLGINRSHLWKKMRRLGIRQGAGIED